MTKITNHITKKNPLKINQNLIAKIINQLNNHNHNQIYKQVLKNQIA